MAFMVVTDNIVRVAKDGCIYEFIRFVSQEDKGKVYCIARKDGGDTNVSVLERSKLPKNEYDAIRMLKKSKLYGCSMGTKEYQKFREDRKQSGSDGLDIARELRTCAEYLNKLAETITGTDDVIEIITVVERAKIALYWTESICTVANVLYGTFKDMEETQSEASTDNSYVTITYELKDGNGDRQL